MATVTRRRLILKDLKSYPESQSATTGNTESKFYAGLIFDNHAFTEFR
jgi:hypothetical protein